MPYQTILYGIAFVALLIGSYTDLKQREVPDWLNFGLMIGGIGIRLIFSLFSGDWSFIVEGIMGFILMVIFAYILFYSGQVGGGDAKLFMGLGAIFGLPLVWDNFLLGFVINVFLIGAIYGLLWSFVVAMRNKKKFFKEWKKLTRTKIMMKVRKFSLLCSAILLVGFLFLNDIFLRFILLSFVILYVLFFYVWVFTKAVEKACMIKEVKPEALTVGDWIPKEIKINGKVIASPKDLGVDEKQIKLLIQLKKQRKIKTVLVKDGIPFVPSFLFGFLCTVYIGNPIQYLLLL